MRRRFATIQDAFAAAKEISKSGRVSGVLAWVFVDYAAPKTAPCHYVATSSGFGLLRTILGGWKGGRGDEFRFGSLDFCGDQPQLTEQQWWTLSERAEQPALPGDQEAWYQLCAGHTWDWNPEQLLRLAQICDDTDCGVWHASHLLHVELHPDTVHQCPCAACKRPH